MTDDGDAAAVARAWLDGPPDAPLPEAGAGVLALAWAFKALCYESWSSEPARTVGASRALARLAAACAGTGPFVEVQALADWTHGVACLTQGQMVDAEAAFERAAAGLRHAGKGAEAAQTQVPRIMALAMLGRHDEAVQCADRARAELLAAGDTAAAGRVALNLGGLLLRRNEYEASAERCRQAAVLFGRAGDHEHSIMADIAEADARAALGDFERALQGYERARQRAEAHGFATLTALVEESLALTDLARGRYPSALAGLASACRRYRELDLPHYVAVADRQLADTYLELNLLPEALRLYDEVLPLLRRLQLVEEQAWVQVQRARALWRQGRRSESTLPLQEAAELFAGQGNEVGQATAELVRAESALAEGRTDDAAAACLQASARFAAAGQAQGGLLAELLLAETRLAAGQLGEAGALYRGLLDRGTRDGRAVLQVRCLAGLGRVELLRGELQAATQRFDSAIELFEDLRRVLPDDELQSSFLSDHLRPYQERLRIALAGGDADAIWRQLERLRARALSERLAADDRRDAGGQAPTDGRRDRLDWLLRRLRRQQQGEGPDDGLERLVLRDEQALLEQLRRQRIALAGAASTASTAGAERGDAEGAAPAPFDPDRLRRALQPGDALVEYGVVDDALFAVLATRDAVHCCPLGSWAAARRALQGVRMQLDSALLQLPAMVAHEATLRQRAQARLQQLHAHLWAPLAHSLAPVRRVLVVPQGELAGVPFAALHDGRHSVGERWRLAVAPSARLALRGLGRWPGAPQRLLAVADARRLPGARQEAQAVAACYPMSRVIVDGEATVEALHAAAPGVDVLHLGCHAIFRSDNPRFSALQLADAPLTADLVETLPLRGALVVLGGCETGLARSVAGDEMFGLVRSFLVAGASRVLASLWPVDDERTARLLVAFHQALRAGDEPGLALQRSREQMRQADPHPRAWGAFVLFGGF